MDGTTAGVAIAAVAVLSIAAIWVWRRRGRSGRSRGLREALLGAVTALVQGDRRSAAERLAEVVGRDTEAVSAYLDLATLVRDEGGDPRRAIRIYQSVLAREGLRAEEAKRALIGLGLAYLGSGEPEKAGVTLRRFIDRHPREPEVVRTLQRIYEEGMDWTKALEMAERLARAKVEGAERNLSVALARTAAMHAERGDIAEAKKRYKKALSADKECVEAWIGIGGVHFEEKAYRKANEAFSRALDLGPADTPALLSDLEEAHLRLDDLAGLERMLRDALTRHRERADLRVGLGRYLLKRDEPEEALTLFQEAARLRPLDLAAREEIGRCLRRLERKGDFASEYGSLVEALRVAEAEAKAGG